jgi:RES domain-containing protein
MAASSNELPRTARSGEYYRVCKPQWADCADTTFSKDHGGRWNPPGEFGALYLNATLRVAAANARRQHAGRAIGLFDLRPQRRPQLATFAVPRVRVVDVVSAQGVAQLQLPSTYPVDVDWPSCQAIARRAYETLAGVASRSAAEARAGEVVGEELAIFDTLSLSAPRRAPFSEWYPDPAPR